MFNSIPYSNFGNTQGYNDDYDIICDAGASTSPDVVYAYTLTKMNYLTFLHVEMDPFMIQKYMCTKTLLVIWPIHWLVRKRVVMIFVQMIIKIG